MRSSTFFLRRYSLIISVQVLLDAGDINGADVADIVMIELERGFAASGACYLGRRLTALEPLRAGETPVGRGQPLDGERGALRRGSQCHRFKVLQRGLGSEVARCAQHQLNVCDFRSPCFAQAIEGGANHPLRGGNFMHRFLPSFEEKYLEEQASRWETFEPSEEPAIEHVVVTTAQPLAASLRQILDAMRQPARGNS